MSYKALYNKYRPRTFEEVAGQRSIVKTLKNAIASGKIGHAYLFCGPRGTGKTSMARLFAKALDCDEGLGHQCNGCLNCVSINEGTHPDVYEIDAASNNGVDQVRELIDQVKYAPLKGRYKIYIIDEVHMMTSGAFNALLKTLEEPPEQVIFILATTEPYKVLPTIISRCQRFDFEKIDDSDIKEKLVWVLNKECIPYEEKGLDAVVELADGGMRDALSILEQVLAYSGESVREEDVLKLFGLTSNMQKIELLKMLRGGDVGGALRKMEEFIAFGTDIKRLSSSLLEILKDLVIFEKTHAASLLTSLDEKSARELEPAIDPVYANKMIAVLLKSQSEYKSVSNVRSLFELTLLQICALSDAEPAQTNPSKPATPIYKEEPKPAPQVEQPKPTPVIDIKPVEEKPHAPNFLFEEDKEIEQPKSEEKEAPAPVEEPKKEINVEGLAETTLETEGDLNSLPTDELVKILVLGTTFKAERMDLAQKWTEFDLLKGHPKIGNLATLLSEAKPFCLCKDALLLSFPFSRLRDRANVKKNQGALSSLVERILNRKVFVYAIDRTDVYEATNKFTSLQQLNQLPKKEDITLNLPQGE